MLHLRLLPRVSAHLRPGSTYSSQFIFNTCLGSDVLPNSCGCRPFSECFRPTRPHKKELDVLRNLPAERRLKVLQPTVVYPKTTDKIRGGAAVCEGKYSGNAESFNMAIREVLKNEELSALGVRPSVEGALQGLASDSVGFCIEAVYYVIIQRIGTYMVKLENASPRSRGRAGRTLFLDLRHAAAMDDSVDVAKKLLEAKGRVTVSWIAAGMGVLAMLPNICF